MSGSTLRTTTSPRRRGSVLRVAKRRSGSPFATRSQIGSSWSGTSLTSRTTAATHGSWGALTRRPASSLALAAPGSTTVWSSRPRGITTLIRTRRIASTSPTLTSGCPVPSMADRLGFGGIRIPGRPGGTPATRWRSIRKRLGRFGALSQTSTTFRMTTSSPNVTVTRVPAVSASRATSARRGRPRRRAFPRSR